MDFEFATAARIIFADGAIQRVPELAGRMGTRALVVLGRSERRALPLLDLLRAARIATTPVHVPGEPTIALVDEALARARRAGSDWVVAMGGGSAIDAGKAIAALLTNPGDILNYLEVIGEGKALSAPPLPCMAIPTTAGTGAEVTKNAVLLATEHRTKVSLRHNLMLPDVALLDPELTHSMPPEVTANTGLDALTQLIEPFVCNRTNPLTDAICRAGLARAARSLARAYHQPTAGSARRDMALASLLGGLALANAKLGAVHGIAGPLGGMLTGAHGALCARLLPLVMTANVHALKSRDPLSPVQARFAELGCILTGDATADAQDGLAWVHDLCRELHVLPLSAHGLTRKDIPVAVEKSKHASSMQGNPVVLTDDELTGILVAAL